MKARLRTWMLAGPLALGLAACAPLPRQEETLPAPVVAPLQPLTHPRDTPARAPASAVAPVTAPPASEEEPGAGEEIGRGGASWYGGRFHNRRTASGERFDMTALTAAHRSLPFGTLVCVRSLVNGRTVVVRINDRGPWARQRVIDLSRAAAQALDMIGLGVKQVALSRPSAAGECVHKNGDDVTPG
jgi:rare lipoprotein A